MHKFEILKTEGAARRGRFHTVHGVIETPVFMNVGTSAAIKGGISTMDLREVGCQVELSNTDHLHLSETELREAFRREFRALTAIYGKPARLPEFAVKAGIEL